MKLASTADQISRFLEQVRAGGERIALVPTMGALHEGHMSLVRLARSSGCYTVLSIFVNPLQFNNKEDLEKYPRDFDADSNLAASNGVDLLFAPEVSAIYPEGIEKTPLLRAGPAASTLEGAFRPGHFDGVVTVVEILFRLVRPQIAIFGEKDFQQLQVIREMTSQLHLPIQIIAAPLLRDPDGLAMSSRNRRLTPEQRTRALRIPAAISEARRLYALGERNAQSIRSRALNLLEGENALKVDYVAIVDPGSFQEVPEISADSRVLIAAWVDGIRLIDTASFGKR